MVVEFVDAKPTDTKGWLDNKVFKSMDSRARLPGFQS